MSRRALLFGAGGLVITTGGVAAWLATGSNRSGSPSSSRASSPSSTTSTPTAPASTALVPDPAAAAPVTPPSTPATATDRVLVVVQLSGGNDALNTLVPVVGGYHDARPSLGLADESLLVVPGDAALGLHPALAPLAPFLADGRLGVVAGVGFEQPDRSHFAALDMWCSAAPDQTFRTGWLGRWLDLAVIDADADLTGATAGLLSAIGLGGAVPALRAERVQAIGVGKIDRFVLPSGDPGLVDAWAGLGGAHTAARLATDIFAELAAATAGDDTGSAPGDGDRVTDRLAVAAELIVTRPDVRVVHVTMGSFDTHANQLDTHAGLLGELAQGLATFQQRIDDAGMSDRVLVITTSEFGRRIAENGSGGTDHGKAGVLFVLGGAVQTEGTAVFGSIDPGDLVDGDLRPVVDPRSAYASALDWLSIDPSGAIADTVVGGGFERLPFLTP
ncbi:MAG: DUF1501 domain-containing protein [Actinobacteria bacterium]|nr:DUF1501 domain-containing protein [Actinomycetota bacterium]